MPRTISVRGFFLSFPVWLPAQQTISPSATFNKNIILFNCAGGGIFQCNLLPLRSLPCSQGQGAAAAVACGALVFGAHPPSRPKFDGSRANSRLQHGPLYSVPAAEMPENRGPLPPDRKNADSKKNEGQSPRSLAFNRFCLCSARVSIT